MPLLHLEPLPRRTTKGELLALLLDIGRLDRRQVGRIVRPGAAATVEVPDGGEQRLVKALDGASFKDRRLRARVSGSPGPASSEGDHFRRLARLLSLESEAEARQTLE